MADAEPHLMRMQLQDEDLSLLTWAFIVSIAFHFLVLGTFMTGQKLGWWQRLHWPAWVQSTKMLNQLLKKQNPQLAQAPQQPMLMYVDVSAAQATAEPPKEAKYYSDKNSLAANPEPRADTDTPKIDGKQTHVVKTEDAPREKFSPLQPTPPPAPKATETHEEAKPAPAYTPGELAMAKPQPEPRKTEGQAPLPKPRTIQEALARLGIDKAPGEKMHQEGGVRRRLEISAVDSRATTTGAYDALLVDAIRSCWFNLLSQQSYASDYRGVVQVQFRLHYDGAISDLTIVENTAGSIPGLLCQTAIDKPHPYPPFPTPMRHEVGDVRNVIFTFYYD